MPISRQLLAIIGRRIPAIYDVIPRGPLGRIAQVALNPQPLPPHELGAAVAAEFVHAAWHAERSGHNLGTVFDDLDDWCPTRPKWPKLPPWWGPFPDPEPEPHPNWHIDFHLGFASHLAALTERFEGTRLGEVVGKAIDRSVETIDSSIG
jgi:hypothetical protein